MNIATKKEIEENYKEAAVLYHDQILSKSNVNEQDYINLAFLYWSFASDYGFSSFYKIPKELQEKGGEEYPKIINDALKIYPFSLELIFWKNYFPFRHYFKQFSQQECEKLIEDHTGNTSLIPYFYLYLFDKVKYKQQRDQLLELCNELPTAKFNYIKSIIE